MVGSSEWPDEAALKIGGGGEQQQKQQQEKTEKFWVGLVFNF